MGFGGAIGMLVAGPLACSGSTQADAHLDGGATLDGASNDSGAPDVVTDDAAAFDVAAPTIYATCKQLLAAQPGLPSGNYTIDPSGPPSQDAFSVYCDMTTAGGGWTKVFGLDAAVVDLVLGSSGRQMLKCSDTGTTSIISPPFAYAWSWARNKSLKIPGMWQANGVAIACGMDPEYDDAPCKTWWGVGCSNGPGTFAKLYPGVLDAPAAETCAAAPAAHTNGPFAICGSNNFDLYAVFVRSED